MGECDTVLGIYHVDQSPQEGSPHCKVKGELGSEGAVFSIA